MKAQFDQTHDDDSFDEYIGESYNSEEESDMDQISEKPSEEGQGQNSQDGDSMQESNELGSAGDFDDDQVKQESVAGKGKFNNISVSQLFADEEFANIYKRYVPKNKAIQQPPSVIYDIVKKTLYTNESKIIWPSETKERIIYLMIAPLTHLQYLSIPNPMIM